MDPKRVATIDIGTNTVLLLVAERGGDGALRAVEERATITRLGEGVDRTRRLAPAAIDRTVVCLDDYARRVRNLGVDRIAVVGTSAMRDAAGGDVISAHVRAVLGAEAHVISGEEEARLTFRGALSGLSLDAREEVAVFDIGGGSTEVVVGLPGNNEGVTFAQSFDIGSVRLSERHVTHDPPTPAEREAVSGAARDAFRSVPQLASPRAPVGIAGTITTLAAVSLGLVTYDPARVHGHMLSRVELVHVMERLASVDLAARREIPGMEPKRADVIVAGGLIAMSLLDHWNADRLLVSDRGVRWGLAEEMTA